MSVLLKIQLWTYLIVAAIFGFFAMVSLGFAEGGLSLSMFLQTFLVPVLAAAVTLGPIYLANKNPQLSWKIHVFALMIVIVGALITILKYSFDETRLYGNTFWWHLQTYLTGPAVLGILVPILSLALAIALRPKGATLETPQ